MLEIEELASAVDNGCSVKESGCLGHCNQAPAAVVVRKRHPRENYFTRIDSLEDSERVVVEATGKKPPTESPELQKRLAGVRLIRQRDFAMSVYRWNGALHATAKLIQDHTVNGLEPSEDFQTFQNLSVMAGYPQGEISSSTEMPTDINKYSKWNLECVTKVSRHSAIFHFSSKDRKRGTPNPRGGGRTPPSPKTWHTTLLAEVGRNEEGPLPWIERDYTPITGARDWERGKCDILIKVYRDGAATSWLHRKILQPEATAKEGPLRVWLSQPVQTLSVPSLVPGTSFNPASVLLLLAGTGVVVLPQIVHHRDPYGKIGISMNRSQQLHVPIDLILSCRNDDVLMLPDIIQRSREGNDEAKSKNNTKGLRRSTLLLTGANESIESCPFPDCLPTTEGELDELHSLPNGRVLNTRLTLELVSEAVSQMPLPCRVVVSGPSGFNSAARGMLVQTNVAEDAITILEA